MKTLIFHYWGGQGRNHGCQSDFLTSTSTQLQVLAKFGDTKHNKDITKIVEKNVFFSSKGGGG